MILMDLMVEMLLTILIAFAVTFVAAKIIIPLLRKAKAGQHVRDDGPQTHLVKEGTPTMGGVIMLIGILATMFLFPGDDLRYAVFSVVTILVFTFIGFFDDALKLFKKRSLGLRAWQKIVLQLVAAAVVACLAYYWLGIDSVLMPGTGGQWEMGVGFIPFTMFVLIAMVNSVNLTDGLDGLASGVTFFVALAYALICLMTSHYQLTVFCGALAGACIGFLIFNHYPARVFMGDTGSMALGGAVAAVAAISRSEIVLLIVGGVYVIEALSVIIQVISFQTTGKRVFLMAPLHHHFELKGWPETRIVKVFSIVSLLFVIVGLLGFKGIGIR
jgi:phospho-N-acetylmuramoyl-pentapeptide-transferase